MSEEYSNYDLIPDTKGVRKAIAAALSLGYDPGTIGIRAGFDVFTRMVFASKDGLEQQWVVHDVWSRTDSLHYRRDARYCDGSEMGEYVRKWAKRLSKASADKQ